MPSPEHDQVVEVLRAFGVKDKVDTPIEDQRASYELAGAAYPLPVGISIDELTIGKMRAEWITPENAIEGRAVLYLHGGGYVIGSISTHREFACRIANATNSKVLIVEYRLAPEHLFPAALDDAVSSFKFLLEEGYRASRLAIIGDSAGGGLTLALLLRLRELSVELPSCAICLSPWVDLTMSGDTMKSHASLDPVVSEESLKMMAQLYIGPEDSKNPLISPLYGDFSGFPPLLIQVGTAEVLLDDSRRLAKKALEQGVQVTLHEFEGLIHVFQAFAALAPESAQAVDEIGAFCALHFAE